jgi:hypothetical protein
MMIFTLLDFSYVSKFRCAESSRDGFHKDLAQEQFACSSLLLLAVVILMAAH